MRGDVFEAYSHKNMKSSARFSTLCNIIEFMKLHRYSITKATDIY